MYFLLLTCFVGVVVIFYMLFLNKQKILLADIN